MPANYYIYLCINPTRMTFDLIVENAIQALLNSNCEYQFATNISIEDSSLPRMQQRRVDKNLDIPIDGAKSLAIRDLSLWGKSLETKWLPGIELTFTYDFLFNKLTIEIMKSINLPEVKKLILSFIIKKNEDWGEYVVVSLQSWESYVLIYGDSFEQAQNKKTLVNICEVMSNGTSPFFGWMDGEHNSGNVSWKNLTEGKWPFGNEYIVLGPDFIDGFRKFNFQNKARQVALLSNGGLILEGR